jgi:hypothetical protein
MTQWRESPSGERQFLGGDGYWYPEGAQIQSPMTIYQRPESKADVSYGSIIAMLGGALVVVGTFLPWQTVHAGIATASRNALQLGPDGSSSFDGFVVLFMGIIIAVAGITRMLYRGGSSRFFKGSAIVAGIVAAAEIAWLGHSINRLDSKAASTSGLVSAHIGYGLYLAGAGAIVGIGAGFILRATKTK